MNDYLTKLEAFNAMQKFLDDYYNRTSSDDVASLCGDLMLFEDGTTADAAAWHDWTRAINHIFENNKNKKELKEHDLTKTEAFNAVRKFLEGYHERTSSDDIASLLGNMQILQNGKTANPITWNNWIDAINYAKDANNKEKFYFTLIN